MITMENKQRVKTIAVIFIIAIVLISLITEFLYIFNNKYTYSKLQPEKGVLTLSQEEIDSNSSLSYKGLGILRRRTSHSDIF